MFKYLFNLMKRPFRKLRKSQYCLPYPTRIEADELAKIYARVFTSDDGKKIMAHLNGIAFHRAAPSDAPDSVLRYMEGHRGLLARMVQLIERGQSA